MRCRECGAVLSRASVRVNSFTRTRFFHGISIRYRQCGSVLVSIVLIFGICGKITVFTIYAIKIVDIRVINWLSIDEIVTTFLI